VHGLNGGINRKARPIVGTIGLNPSYVRRGICELLAHLTMLIAFLMTIRLLERVLQWLWGTDEKNVIKDIPVDSSLRLLTSFCWSGFLTYWARLSHSSLIYILDEAQHEDSGCRHKKSYPNRK